MTEQEKIQNAFEDQLAQSIKMIGDPFDGQSIEDYLQVRFNESPDTIPATFARLTEWREQCAEHQGEARLLYFGEVDGQPLKVYYAWESDLETLHERWELSKIPRNENCTMPRLHKKAI